MNPVLLIFITIYLVVVFTQTIISNKSILESTNPIFGNIIVFIRTHIDNIFLTVCIMLGLIVYFAVIGVNLDDRPTKYIDREIVIEKYENLDSVENIDQAISHEKVKDKLIEHEYAKSHHNLTHTLSSIERDKKCREKSDHTCEIDPNCILCLGPTKGCLGGSGAGITHALNDEKCNHFLFNGEEHKHVKAGLGITHKID
jgi:hypothetical protein